MITSGNTVLALAVSAIALFFWNDLLHPLSLFGPMFIVGNGVKGGFYGKTPSLTGLDDGNLKMTTDFRRVYATVIAEWMGHEDPASILKGNFLGLNAFA